ncbi:STAS domain-containing protein [Actinomadura sp. 3N508]|uniref:STAS domain-containing protein n=1 Tax=Actinomadura sp. 3N508 TaxID=3375153 RepID=UPI00378C5324
MTPQQQPTRTAEVRPLTGNVSHKAGLTSERLADQTVITLSGDLDAASTTPLRERLYVALRDAGAYVIIDLAGVTRCDESGLAMLAGARRRTEAKGGTMVLAAPRPRMEGLLRATGLLRVFTVRSSVAAARTAGPGARSAAA